MQSHRETAYARDQAKAELATASEVLNRERARREADLVEKRAQVGHWPGCNE